MSKHIIDINNVSKTYKDGFQALKNIKLSLNAGEIFALLGPNGAGKTTLISMICGVSMLNEGQIKVGGHDILSDPKKARQLIGLVPQELTTNLFEKVWNTVTFSRGVFGLKPNDKYIEEILKSLSLWDKKDNTLMTLSGGMKRRVMIAKALAHEPQVLFLDEPTAGVDVALRRDMWAQIHKLRQSGVTIILTTHYLEEAEEMADRIGVINHGELILVDEKDALIQRMGKKTLCFKLNTPLQKLPDSLSAFNLEIKEDILTYEYNAKCDKMSVEPLFTALQKEGITYSDISTKQSSLEDIFVELVKA